MPRFYNTTKTGDRILRCVRKWIADERREKLLMIQPSPGELSPDIKKYMPPHSVIVDNPAETEIEDIPPAAFVFVYNSMTVDELWILRLATKITNTNGAHLCVFLTKRLLR